MNEMIPNIAQFHLPGLFEFFDFYERFLPIFFDHREYFYEWVNIASLYGAPYDCIWGGGRFGSYDNNTRKVLELISKYKISARLTFSNSLLRKEHLLDKKCNKICNLFNSTSNVKNGIIIYSDLLLDYIKENYKEFYFVSSTTKVLTDFNDFLDEINNPDFSYVVADFRLNKEFEKLGALTYEQKNKVEFLCNECCYIGCNDRHACYENVSQRILGEENIEHICKAPFGNEGYKFSRAMESPAFISVEDIKNKYVPLGFTNFKIEGRGLGTAVLLEFLLYYLVKTEHQLKIREMMYLDSMLDIL